MAQNPEKAFEIKNGIIIDSSSGVFSGSDSPINLLNPSPGSIYLRTNGEVWRKFGDLINEWEILGSTALPTSSSNLSFENGVYIDENSQLNVNNYSVSINNSNDNIKLIISGFISIINKSLEINNNGNVSIGVA